MIKREEALKIVKKYVKTENSVKHMLATEAVMRKMADHFDEDEDFWGIAGLLHDVDMEEVDYENNPKKHGPKTIEILKDEGLEDEKLFEAILAHNPEAGKEPETLVQKVIRAVDPLTGLIVASTLISPDKDINKIDADFVMRRFNETSFARGADRDIIKTCASFDMELEKFIELSLEGMQNISDVLELE
ncbi:MAG: HD domain-containing protein [Patescibacteria group bacterium]